MPQARRGAAVRLSWRSWLPWVAALLAVALFCSLGFWQLDRSRQKQALLDGVGQVLEARSARPLAEAAMDPARRQGYDWASGHGHFVDAPAVVLDNQNREGRAGVRIYRVFQPQDASPLLVDLGWLPLPGDRTLPRPPRPEGEMRLEGLLAPPFAGGIARAAPAVQAHGDLLVIKVDPAVLSAALGLAPPLAPRVLRLDPALPLGHVRDLDVLPNTLPPERHLGYAVQWFGLAAAVLITALLLGLRKLRSARPRSPQGRNSP